MSAAKYPVPSFSAIAPAETSAAASAGVLGVACCETWLPAMVAAAD
jgi:hypothetical protein